MPKKILVVDDEKQKAQLIELKAGEYCECSIDYAETAMKGVLLYEEALKSGRGYDLVVTDLKMPADQGKEAKEDTGVWLYKYIKAKDKSWTIETPIIFHTSYSKSHLEKLLTKYGVIDKVDTIISDDFDSYDLLKRYLKFKEVEENGK